MSHSSQVTQAEYANKHESNITSKMANIWERKIDSGKEHKPSPTTVVNEPSTKMDPIKPLTKAASKNASSTLQRKNTREIVQSFERMASNNDGSTKNSGVSGVDKMTKKSSLINRKMSTEAGTAVKQRSMKSDMKPLAKAPSTHTSSDFRRKNTREIVETFERMASDNDDTSNLGVSGVDHFVKKSSTVSSKMSSESKEDISKMVERISKQMKDLNHDIGVLKSKIDNL